MGLKDIWQKTSFYRNKVKRDEQEKEQETLRKEVLEEIKPELKQAMKEKIKQEEIEKIKHPPVKKNFLNMLGEEFKGSNIGSNEQMGKILGKQTNNNNSSLIGSNNNKNFGEMMGTGNLNTNRDFGKLLGRDRSFSKDSEDIIGMKGKQQDIADKIGGIVRKRK